MPSEDDIIAQQTLLQAHRQTLDVLLTQQAQLGEFNAPPAVVNGIRAARGSIAQIKQTLRDWNVHVDRQIRTMVLFLHITYGRYLLATACIP